MEIKELDHSTAGQHFLGDFHVHNNLEKPWPDLGDLELNRETLLQDADDALITSETEDT